MATEKRLIEIIECLRNCANNTDCERCSRWLHPCDEKCVDDLMATAAEELEKFVNAVEVAHGRWEQVQRWATKAKYRCSVCGREIMSAVKVNSEKYPYCHCGAKMDGDGN